MSLTKVTNSMIKGAVASVLDYGADNTGVADSATAISNAIASGAGVVELPAGTYKIASTISIPSNVILRGQGFGTSGAKTTISYTGSGNAVEYVGTSGTPVRWGGIENISITAASSCNALLRVKGAREGSFTNVSLIGASNADYCLLVEADTDYGTYYNTFTKVEGVGSAIANLLVNGDVATTGTARANGNSFFDCRFDSGNGVGISLSGCDQIDFFGQAVEGNTGTGVVIGVSGETAPTRMSFFGGYIENQSATYDLDSSNASTGGNGPINFFVTRISSAKIAPGSLYRNYGMAGQIVSETDVILERSAANTLATDGTFQVGRGGDARYNEGLLRLGTYYLWVDTSDRLRIKSSAPASDTDGTVVDDYFEGTWTVTLYDASTGGNASATTTTGHYTKIGNKVTCSFQTLSDISTAGMTGGNTLYISLPVAASATAAKAESTGSIVLNTFDFPASTTYICPVTDAGLTRSMLLASGTGVAHANVTVAAITTGTSDIVRFSLTYLVDV